MSYQTDTPEGRTSIQSSPTRGTDSFQSETANSQRRWLRPSCGPRSEGAFSSRPRRRIAALRLGHRADDLDKDRTRRAHAVRLRTLRCRRSARRQPRRAGGSSRPRHRAACVAHVAPVILPPDSPESWGAGTIKQPVPGIPGRNPRGPYFHDRFNNPFCPRRSGRPTGCQAIPRRETVADRQLREVKNLGLKKVKGPACIQSRGSRTRHHVDGSLARPRDAGCS